jgi:ornithine cyclodeaminase/alanine dehydrogenase-like protein (mu-crystallin family)
MRRPLCYLSAADVVAAMPPLQERIALAERTMVALVHDAELPPKIGVSPRPDGSFAHAMPALSRGATADGSDDRLGIKWVTGFPANRAYGLPAIHATVILSDAQTGLPTTILDGGPITAERTAAVSAVAITRFGPAPGGRPPVVAIIGAGVQGRSHLAPIGHVLPGARVVIHARRPDAAQRLVDLALITPGIGGASVAASAREATQAADVVVTAVTFTTPDRRQAMTSDWLRPDALVVPIDYATMCSAEVARDASLFLVDDRDQFLANRAAGHFDAYPDPVATIGQAIVDGIPRPPTGRVVVTHLGIGLADVLFGAAIAERAAEMGLGTVLPG